VPAVSGAVGEAEADVLFADLAAEGALVLAVSGGPDSTALLYLMARWRASRRPAPYLLAVSIDHGLRPESRLEAAAVKRLSEKLGVEHRTMRWSGAKPSTGIQEAARAARYPPAAHCGPPRKGALRTHSPYTRRSGRNRAVPHGARQRACRHVRNGAQRAD